MADRNVNQGEITRLQKKGAKYTPGSTFRFLREKLEYPPDVLRIGLFGPPGVGKSSFINSLNFATMDANDDNFAWVSIAPEGYSDAPSKTLAREAFYVAENIAVIDNRGMKQLGGRFMVELGHQIAGASSDGQDVEWDVGYIRSLAPGLERAFRASKECEIHCPVLVISALNLSIKAEDLKELLAQIQKMTGSPPVVILTNRQHWGVREEVISEFRTGLQSQGFDYIFELENYTRDNHQYNPEKHLILLQILDQCTMVGDRVMRFKEKSGGCVLL